MWYRAAVMGWGKRVTPLASAAACCAVCLLACGEDASKPPAPTEADTSAEPAPQPEQTPASDDLASRLPADGEAFRLSIDGWAEELGAKAQLNVTEGQRAVRLEITGTGRVDVLFLDVDFDGIEGSMGAHALDLGLPGDAIDSASATLGGQVYHSQSGHVEVTLSADGNIHGSFDVALALDPATAVPAPGQPSEPVKFEISDDLRPLTGDFAGTWQLFCQSHLPGHSGQLIEGGHYCEGVAFQ
jgi:hypothetical protein